jgi:hypothetical protein
MIPASVCPRDFAQGVAAELGRSTTEPGVDRLRAAIEAAPALTIQDEMRNAVVSVKSVTGPTVDIIVSHQLRWSGINQRFDAVGWNIRMIPTGPRCSLYTGDHPTIADAVAAALKEWKIGTMEQEVRARVEREMRTLAAVEADPNAAHKAEFLANMDAVLRGEVPQ